MLKQRLSQKLLQKLSPQQIQLMKLLQIPTTTLDQRIKEELEANPALEEGDTFESPYEESEEEKPAEEETDLDAQIDETVDIDDYLEEYFEDDPSSYRYKTETQRDDEKAAIPIALSGSFHDYLEEQLGMLDLENAREAVVAHQIIGSIDDDGYLRREPISIIDDLLFSQNLEATEDEVLKLLAIIQTFDPPGVGARNLRECLLIQLRQKMEQDRINFGEVQPARELAFKILEFYFDEFSKKHYHKLQKYLEIAEAELKIGVDEILKLNPKPASAYTGSGSHETNYIVPDFIIMNRDGELELVLNSQNAPELKINEQFVDILKSYNERKKKKKTTSEDRKAVMFIKQKIDAAKWFIDAIRQRQQTLYKTMYAIMKFQNDYFLTGDERRVRPMILKDIAEITDLDISTVSRVANSKFVQTEFGTKRLKDFFSESLQTQSGEEVSTLEVKNILSDIITEENKRKPLSDEKLKSMLQEKGYNIARRTVAKYREQLNIPVARLRKEL